MRVSERERRKRARLDWNRLRKAGRKYQNRKNGSHERKKAKQKEEEEGREVETRGHKLLG